MRAGMIDTQAIRQRWESVGSKLDERGRRVFAAGEVRATGWGGLEAVSEITGLARSTIGRGLKDLDAAPLPKGRVRRKGGDRYPAGTGSTLAKSSPRAFIPLISNLVIGVDSTMSVIRSASLPIPNDMVRPGRGLALLRSELNSRRVSLRTDLGSELPEISADRVQLQQSFRSSGRSLR